MIKQALKIMIVIGHLVNYTNFSCGIEEAICLVNCIDNSMGFWNQNASRTNLVLELEAKRTATFS